MDDLKEKVKFLGNTIKDVEGKIKQKTFEVKEKIKYDEIYELIRIIDGVPIVQGYYPVRKNAEVDGNIINKKYGTCTYINICKIGDIDRAEKVNYVLTKSTDKTIYITGFL